MLQKTVRVKSKTGYILVSVKFQNRKRKFFKKYVLKSIHFKVTFIKLTKSTVSKTYGQYQYTNCNITSNKISNKNLTIS